jgi:hypothetical protein
VSHHRHHWSRDKRPQIEREWESYAIRASMARPPLPDVSRPVPMKIEAIIAQACAQDATYAAARAAWEAEYVDAMPEELKAYREALSATARLVVRKVGEVTPSPPRTAREAAPRPSRPALSTSTCALCAAAFPQPNRGPGKLYCSPRCAKRAEHQRARARRNEQCPNANPSTSP